MSDSKGTSSSTCDCFCQRRMLYWRFDAVRRVDVGLESEMVTLLSSPTDEVDGKQDSVIERVFKLQTSLSVDNTQQLSLLHISGPPAFTRSQMVVHERFNCRCERGKVQPPCLRNSPHLTEMRESGRLTMSWNPSRTSTAYEVCLDLLVLSRHPDHCASLKVIAHRDRNLLRECLCSSEPEQDDCEGPEIAVFKHFAFEYSCPELALKARHNLTMKVPFRAPVLGELRHLFDTGSISLNTKRSEFRSLCISLGLYDIASAMDSAMPGDKQIVVRLAPSVFLQQKYPVHI